jgi:environmental stress-induced protein Ves
MSAASTSAAAPRIIAADQVPPQPWRNGGGQTRELLAWPTPADWQLRISRADIEASGPFSAFAGVQRWFVVLSGNGLVLRMPTPDAHTLDHHLLPGHQPLHFDGALAPFCQLEDGPTQDLNLMCRGGQAGMVAVEPDEAWLPEHPLCGLYTAQPGTWSDGRQTLRLAAHTLLWLPQGAASALHFQPEGAALPLAWWLGFTPEQHP